MKSIKSILKSLFFLSFIFFISLSSFAQYGGGPKFQEKKEKIKALKVAFLTEKLSLTPDEAQVFWPVYNEYEAKKEAEQNAFRDKYILHKINFHEMSDEEAEEVIDAHIIHMQRMLDIEKTYNVKFKEALPVKKVLMLFKAENEFKKILLERIGGGNPENMRKW